MGMYNLYLDTTLFPVTPEKIETKVDGNNKTVNLISGGEVNMIKSNKLQEISFDLMLPNHKYPFAMYRNGFKAAAYYLNVLKKLKARKTPFKFKVLRLPEYGTDLKDTSISVTLENYKIVEDAEDNSDITVSITLKEYKQHKAKKIVNGKVKKSNDYSFGFLSKFPKNGIYVTKKGDTLLNIAKKFYGDGSIRTDIYKKNKKTIENAAKKHKRKSSSNGKYLYKGTKLRLPTNVLIAADVEYFTPDRRI